MGMMIVMMAAQLSIGLLMGVVQYGLMAYVIAYAGRRGWEAGKRK